MKKRLLCLVLSLVMLLSASVIGVSAAEANVLMLNDCESQIGSWVAAPGQKTEGANSVCKNFWVSGNADTDYGVANLNCNFTLTAATVDATGYETLKFDIFVTDPSILEGVQFGINLSSGSNYNSNSKSIYPNLTGLTVGWNTISLPLSEFGNEMGTFDITKINYLRIYNQQKFTVPADAEAGRLFVAIDNIHFAKAAAPETDVEPEFSSAVAAFLNIFKKFTVLQHMPVFGKIFGFVN